MLTLDPCDTRQWYSMQFHSCNEHCFTLHGSALRCSATAQVKRC